ncbi:DNA repair protein RecO [Funiculus sociatus GB2-A5]|uniref:DNA repair protein RecO n=1 Tax=Funiculus sociatus GB2-A5 TaxID=2933946 RepID=A0ABV0JHZ2_9CYAN|nr:MULTISPECIES: DNA repair protein RecO [unclassified Trichocoleus]MBD1904535.1 DNA repair protein RecO [Trichocoleus sp. FACHB-832]MBD2064466.1 DNA repair protein RecO [Trichocoleus sp. FACHB-6]
MSRTYKVTGINLKGMPLGESDRLLTILTREFGLIRAVAPGARKHHSKMGGRSGLFVVNELLIAKGRSLDKITQAETIESYPGLSQDLRKLTASQYLAELVLCQALSDQPQEELYELLNEHLRRLEQLPSPDTASVLAHLTHGVFHLMALAGVAPEVQECCVTRQPLLPQFNNPDWRVGFSAAAGGTVSLPALERLQAEARAIATQRTRGNLALKNTVSPQMPGIVAQEKGGNYQTVVHAQTPLILNTKLNAVELALLQKLAQPELPQVDTSSDEPPTMSEESIHPLSLTHHPSYHAAWVGVEQILRQYVQFQFGRSIRSAALMDACF